MSQSVQIKVAKNGKVIIEAKGVEGPGCLTLVEPFVKALGGQSEFEQKPEFAKSPDVQQNQEAEAGQ